MSMAEVQTFLSALPERERVELAGWLLESVTGEPDQSVLAESIAIADERQAQLEAGHAKLLSEQEFWAKISRSSEK